MTSQTHPTARGICRAKIQIPKHRLSPERAPFSSPHGQLRGQGAGPGPQTQRTNRSTQWGAGDGLQAEGQVYAALTAPKAGPDCWPCLLSPMGPPAAAWPPRLICCFTRFLFTRIRGTTTQRERADEEDSSPELQHPPLLLCYRLWDWGHRVASKSHRKCPGHTNPLPTGKARVFEQEGPKVFTKASAGFVHRASQRSANWPRVTQDTQRNTSSRRP